MSSPGLFDHHFRLKKIDRNGDPLRKLNELVPWESFRDTLETIRDKPRKSNAGRKPFDVILMFKMLVLQSLYNLSDDQLEQQVLDRLSFMRFLGLDLGDAVPDAKTIWLFREQLKEAGLVETIFVQFNAFLQAHGFAAQKGQIVDASIVSAPKQRNSRNENELIKQGDVPDDWSEAKRRQKDVDARWTKKRGVAYYGYKNHISVDVKHKFVRSYAVTDAAVHDSQVFDELLDVSNTSRDVWADSAYRSEEKRRNLEAKGFREHLQRKGYRNRPLTDWEQRGNRTRARIRSRVEHVFGVMAKRAGDGILRTIGLLRASLKIGLRNLAYNLDRYAGLAEAAT
jgi:IS5 family transposase